ncbi:ribonuclease P protein component [Mycobacterium sp. SM1]|uniref:ribonuclease P protein component n=1 Tax=Mycobacterium sp. SM1 TaxID=2816243 RepID=UPI001BCDBC6A|nr:ribonuclease P protein component [Mycobacterium sp. SM1]MBS4728113.1 ribonuclease P protein component [Mycobacterium sp. SM1]
MLPARNRMRRSKDFDTTIKFGVRVVQPDIVVHVRLMGDRREVRAPRIGLIVGKSIGSAVERHRVARRLRSASRAVLGELDHGEDVVIRALGGSRNATSARLEQELRTGLRRCHELAGAHR